MYRISDIINSTCISDTSLKSVEPKNTSGTHFFLDFYLTNGTLYLLVFKLAYRNVNHTFFSCFETSNYISHPLLYWFHSLKTSQVHCFLRFKLDSLDSNAASCILISKYLLLSLFHVLEPWICPRRVFLLFKSSKANAANCYFF